MKMAFVWDFAKPDGMVGWRNKDDSFQYTIKKFSETNDCAIFAKNKEAEIFVEGENKLLYSLAPTWQEIMRNLGTFGPDIIFSQGFETDLSKAIPDFFPQTKKVLTYVGGPLSGKVIPYDVISVSRERQKEEMLRMKEVTEKKDNVHINLNIAVIPYGVNIEVFKMQNINRPIDVVCVADNLPVKRLHLLKKAQEHMKNLKFSFIGYEARVPYGFMPNIFNAAKISAIVSTREDGGPRVVPESLACGTPVLTCWDSEGIWSATADFELVGKVVMPDVGEICSGIKELIESTNDNTRKICRKVAVDELSYEQMYEKYKVVVDELSSKIG